MVKASMPHRTSPTAARSRSGQSPVASSPKNGPGSASSVNGSIRSDDEPDGDQINVVVRVRPLNARELKNDDTSICQFPGDGGVWVDEQKGDRLRPFTFNVVFEPEASQEDVIDHSGVKKLIDMAIDGFSCTCFCYGQTGSGKTHTLTGPPHLFQSKRLDPLHPDHGLVFRAFIYLYDELQKRGDTASYVIRASYLEIYNEKVIDLLNPGTKRSNLNVRWDKKSRAFVVDNLFSIECNELDDLVAVLEEGLKNRAIGTHNMNEHSSRSHTILTVHIHSEEKATSDDNKGVYITRHGKINFVDLAGSEMTKKTKSEGKTLEEANNINKSLMVLGYCIAQLSSQRKSDKGVHIPYRDSKLTKLLADSLAGNGVTLMIACVSPAKSNLSETSNTLRYAARAKKIRTKPVVVMDPREALIVSLKREVNILHHENDHLRQLLALADSDGAGDAALGNGSRNGSSANLLAHMALEKNGLSQPLDGRDLKYDPSTGPDSGESGFSSRPPSQRSQDTLRKVSALLFIATPATVKRVDKSRLNELDSSTLVDLIKDYMSENQDLRKENQDLFAVRDMLLRDQELVCRENERLLKKLEDVTSVCCRSPIAPVRPTYSAELLSASMNGSLPRSAGATGSAPDLADGHEYGSDWRSSPVTNVWTNHSNPSSAHYTSYNGNSTGGLRTSKPLTPSQSLGNLDTLATGSSPHGSRSGHRLPPNVNKELEKRKIGSSLTNIADNYRDKSHRKLTRKSSNGSEISHDDVMTAVNGRKKPGLIRDVFVERNSSSPAVEQERHGRSSSRKERTKVFREKSRSKERSRMDDASKF